MSGASLHLARPSAKHLAVMVTRRCNMSCDHCSVRSEPGLELGPSDEHLRRRVEEAIDAGVMAINLTGGEPMLRPDLVFELVERARKHSVHASVTSNGTWARSDKNAQRILRRFDSCGLSRLVISYDRYHAEYAGTEALRNIACHTHEVDFEVQLNIVRGRDEGDVEAILAAIGEESAIRVRFYDLQPVGRAEDLIQLGYRDDVEGACAACDAPALTDDDRITACNGPAYFESSDSPLVVGSLAQEAMVCLLRRHRADPILQTIRSRGPEGLRRDLLETDVGRRFEFRASYRGMCELCRHITGDEGAVAALRERAARPALRAEMVARDQLARSHRMTSRTRDQINRGGAARFYLDLLNPDGSRPTPTQKELEAVFGRADFDWNHHRRMLVACGLARPLLPHLRENLARWAPKSFLAELERAAQAAAIRQMAQRRVLEVVARAADDLGICGVVLKGGTFLADGSPVRDTGDLDLHFGGEAEALRERLLDAGFEGESGALRTGAHHLAPVVHRGVVVELHERIMPSLWALPEEEMASAAEAMDGFAPLRRLDAAGFLLHAMVHSSGHVFSHGLKAAVDREWGVSRLDGSAQRRLEEWLGDLPSLLAFRVPWIALCAELDEDASSLRLPAASAALEKRLLLIARKRLFEALDDPIATNPFVKNGIYLMMQPSPLRMLRQLTLLLGREARQSRRASRPEGRASLAAQWAQARRALSQYRLARKRSGNQRSS